MSEYLVQLKCKTKTHAVQKLKEVNWIVTNLQRSGNSDKWVRKWRNWKFANPYEAKQVIAQIPGLDQF